MENSIHSNITIRNPQRVKSNSLNNILEIDTDESSTFLDATRKSLPTADLNSSILYEMKEQLKTLRTELESAHEEIVILNNENTHLKQQLKDMNKKIETLIKLTSKNSSFCSTPNEKYLGTPINHNKKSLTKRKIQSIRTFAEDERLENSSPGGLATLDHHKKQADGMTENVPIKKDLIQEHKSELFPREAIEMNQLPKAPGNKEVTSDKTSSNKKIHILGDQTCLGLSKLLIESRKKKWNDNYCVTGYSKPEATSADILSSCDDLIKNACIDDVFILMLGSNDYDPYKFVFQLCNALYKLKAYRVIIVQVSQNRYISSNMQNHYIKLLCANYEHTKFIEANQVDHKSLCFKLNIEIDSYDYNKQFLNLSKLRIHQVNELTNKKVKKGTIPYYFKKDVRQPKTPLSVKSDKVGFQQKSEIQTKARV